MTIEVLPTAISDPITGEEIDPRDVDALAEAFSRATRLSREVSTFVRTVKLALGAHAKGDARTQRVNGERHRVRIELPYSKWDQPALAELWREHPRLAARYVKEKVEVTYQPLLKEIAKLREESGPEAFVEFKSKLLAAELPAMDAPSIKVETATIEELGDQEREIGEALTLSIGGYRD